MTTGASRNRGPRGAAGSPEPAPALAGALPGRLVRALRGHFPIPARKFAAQADEATHVVSFDIPLPPACVDGAIAADLERRCAGERTVGMVDRHGEAGALIERRRSTLRERVVVLVLHLAEHFDATAEALMRSEHEARALCFGDQHVPRAEVIDAGRIVDPVRGAGRIDGRHTIDDEEARIAT